MDLLNNSGDYASSFWLSFIDFNVRLFSVLDFKVQIGMAEFVLENCIEESNSNLSNGCFIKFYRFQYKAKVTKELKLSIILITSSTYYLS